METEITFSSAYVKPDIREWMDSRLPEDKRQYNSPTTSDEIHCWFFGEPKYYDDPSFVRNSWNWFMMRAWSYIHAKGYNNE